MNQTVGAPHTPGCQVRQVAHAGWTEHFIQAGTLEQLVQWLEHSGAHLVGAQWFGDTQQVVRTALAPLAILQGSGSGCYGGVQAQAISGVRPAYLHQQGRVVGAWWEDAFATYCWLNDLSPADPRCGREEQTTATLESIETLLQPLGMDFRNVYRTWFYLDDILDWYGPFNQVRTEFFRSRNVFGGLMPASTGVGATNPKGTAVQARAAAIRLKDPRARVRRVDSPLQCSAYDYGSAFSRAVCLSTPDQELLTVSGTASIEPGGRTVHQGDTRAQIELTIAVVGAILAEAGLQWTDVVQAIGYFRDPREIGLWAAVAERQLPALPILLTQCDICRDDLLFELELTAAACP